MRPVEQSLPSLLWSVLAGLDRAHRDHGAGAGARPSLELRSNLLRVIDDEGVPRRDLPEMLCLSKRAARSNVSFACRRGWVEELGQGRDRRVRFTDAGRAVVRQWPSLREAAECTWEQRAGSGALERARQPLAVLVSNLPLEHPHYPASYGAADPRVTGGHGRDWKPVSRSKRDAATGLPLSALLSEALMAFALAYEDRAGVALPVAARVLCPMSDEGRDARSLDIPPGWLSALVRHGLLHTDQRRDGLYLTLTSRGRELALAHAAHVQAVEEQWSTELGSEVVHNARAGLGT